MKSETRRESAVVDLVKILNYFKFDTIEIERALNRGELDHVRDLVEEAINNWEVEMATKGSRSTITGLVDRGTRMRRVRDERSRSPRKPLQINIDDSKPIRMDKPRGINTNVPKVKGPQIRKRNIEKSMEEFIPSKRSSRFT